MWAAGGGDGDGAGPGAGGVLWPGVREGSQELVMFCWVLLGRSAGALRGAVTHHPDIVGATTFWDNTLLTIFDCCVRCLLQDVDHL